MPETYTLEVEKGRLVFMPAKDDAAPACVLAPRFSPAIGKAGLSVAARMGDPELLHCVVFRYENSAGGVFVLHDRTGLLLAALAKSNLAYAMGAARFGEMVANARYGVDVFENMEEPDD